MRIIRTSPLCLLLIVGCFLSCQETPSQVEKKTQALILTQDLPFSAVDTQKSKEGYFARTSLIIPIDLPPQNTWLMFEGPVLENDIMAYRFYGDSRHRSDIYAKSVNSLVMDTVGWDYHNIQNWGADVLKVGNSLGIGSPAIWYQDSLYTFSEYEEKQIAVIENNGETSTIRFTIKGLKIDEYRLDIIHDWSIRSGQYYTSNKLQITRGALPPGACFATGIVKHLEQIATGDTEDIHYAYNWGRQSFHKENLGLAILIPKELKPTKLENELSHVYLFKESPSTIHYAFLAAWERGGNGIQNEIAFKEKVKASSIHFKF